MEKIVLDASQFAGAAAAAFRMKAGVPADSAALKKCGQLLIALPGTVDEFERQLDEASKERLRQAALKVKPRYRKTCNLLGFLHDIGGRASDPRKANAHDFGRMHTFFEAMSSTS